MFIPNRTISNALTVLAAVLVVAGCSRAPLTAPETPDGAPSDAVAPPPPSRLSTPTDPADLSLSPDSLLPVLDWQLIKSVFVLPDVDAAVTCSHYSLRFAKGSLAKAETITIKEYDSNVLDVEFGPSGTKFDTPVMLSIDFAGTPADPRTAYADQSEPVLWWLNETTNRWEAVPGGFTDWAHMKYVVPLEHFSRYVLGGKAGWKQSPRTENDD
jgi:hypothetical protein